MFVKKWVSSFDGKAWIPDGVGGEVWEHGGGEVDVLLPSTLFCWGVKLDIVKCKKLGLNSKTPSVVTSLGIPLRDSNSNGHNRR